MMAFSLSRRDINVLGRIRDPESNAGAALRLDSSLPRDPHVTDLCQYERASQKEKDLVLLMQQAEMELAELRPKSLEDPLQTYCQSVVQLGQLIDEFPNYASVHNNRAQALRRLYGDDMLLQRQPKATDESAGESTPARFANSSRGLLEDASGSEEERATTAATVLSDLDRCIALLAPADPLAIALSPRSAKTLSLAFTQRAAIYYATSKHMGPSRAVLPRLGTETERRPEAQWTKLDFEEAASRDFDMGGRLGNDVARGLAVGTNPTAKLCGQIVQQMMRKEYGSFG